MKLLFLQLVDMAKRIRNSVKRVDAAKLRSFMFL